MNFRILRIWCGLSLVSVAAGHSERESERERERADEGPRERELTRDLPECGNADPLGNADEGPLPESTGRSSDCYCMH